MLVHERKSVGKENITSPTATSAANHTSKDTVNTSWWCAPKPQPQDAPFLVCIVRRALKLKQISLQ